MTNKKKITTSLVVEGNEIKHYPVKPNYAEEQCFLDKHKYFKSIEAGKDMSGSMPYCYGCRYRKDDHCNISHEERIIRNACALTCHGSY